MNFIRIITFLGAILKSRIILLTFFYFLMNEIGIKNLIRATVKFIILNLGVLKGSSLNLLLI